MRSFWRPRRFFTAAAWIELMAGAIELNEESNFWCFLVQLPFFLVFFSSKLLLAITKIS